MHFLYGPEALCLDIPPSRSTSGSNLRPNSHRFLRFRVDAQDSLRSILHHLDPYHHLFLLRHSSPRVHTWKVITFLPFGRLSVAHHSCLDVLFLPFRPIFLDLYGYNNYFCWFNASSSAEQFGLKMGYFYGPLWIFFVLEVYWAHQTFKKLKAVGL